jgi:hypothetical protein
MALSTRSTSPSFTEGRLRVPQDSASGGTHRRERATEGTQAARRGSPATPYLRPHQLRIARVHVATRLRTSVPVELTKLREAGQSPFFSGIREAGQSPFFSGTGRCAAPTVPHPAKRVCRPPPRPVSGRGSDPVVDRLGPCQEGALTPLLNLTLLAVSGRSLIVRSRPMRWDGRIM